MAMATEEISNHIHQSQYQIGRNLMGWSLKLSTGPKPSSGRDVEHKEIIHDSKSPYRARIELQGGLTPY